MGAITALLATLLVLAHRRLQVADDPRIAAVQSLLPQTNCGGCGFPGCRAFAEALVAGETMPSRCGVISLADHQRIASYLGIGVGSDARRVARLACAGGDNVSVHHAQYVGAPTCASATIVSGGGKGCFGDALGWAIVIELVSLTPSQWTLITCRSSQKIVAPHVEIAWSPAPRISFRCNRLKIGCGWLANPRLPGMKF